MATNTSDFFTFSKTAGTAKNLQKPTDGGDNNLWGGYINVNLSTIVGAVNATSDLIADANQNELVDFTATGSAVNHVGITNAATGNGPTIEAKGDDTNIDLNVSGKGTGKLATTSPKITTGINDSNNNELIKVTATGSAVNEITVANAATGNGPTLSATGDDTNIDLNIAGKGTGEIEIASNIAFSNDTDAKVKLPSGGGIYESDGSTPILTESSGVASLRNVVHKTSANAYKFLDGGELNSLGYLNRNFFGASYYLSAGTDLVSGVDTAITSGFTWTKQPSSGSSGSDDADIFARFSSGQFTGGVSGYYLVNFQASINDLDEGEYLQISVRINNDSAKRIAIARFFTGGAGSSANTQVRANCTGIAALDTNDTLTPYAIHNEGSNRPLVTDQRTAINFYYLGTSDL